MKQEKQPLRDEIECVVKMLGIDRRRFCEYSKQRYAEILERFYREFFETPRRQTAYSYYPYLYMRKKWRKTASAGLFTASEEWEQYLARVREMLPCSGTEKLLLITREDFVYEGYPQELFAVLAETDCCPLGDFYLVSPKFEWLAVYSDDGESAALYEKGAET